ncbi:MAG: acyl-CoA dehydrogenase family protein, partial [Chloroflexota bacterium]
IDGRKTYTTMAPALRFMMVSATIEGAEGPEAGQFLLERGLPGLYVEETWDTVGMRASGSHDLVLAGVRAPAAALLSRRPYTPGDGRAAPAAPEEPSSTIPAAPATVERPARPPGEGAGWAALIPAVYLGVATAARNAAVEFARGRRPQPLGGKSIGELPAIQRLLGEIDVALAEARALLFGTAEAWLEAPHQRPALLPLLGAAKYVVTNRAVEITDKAMRVVGAAGLARSHPIQRYYRDVRAGLHHPPMDDVALATLAKAALEQD